jgi:hypothetical protein
MQRKLISALVAGALELYAASVSAQAAQQCNNSLRTFSVGQANPITSYGEYVADSNGLALQICKDDALCFFDPIVAGNLLSAQTGTGGESFYWLSDAGIVNANTGFDLRMVMAVEATYTTEEPTPGAQLTFTRFRVRIDTPFAGTYTVVHPYGTETYVVDAVTAGDEVRETFDIAFVPGQTDAVGRVGPWLRWTADAGEGLLPTEALAPAGHIGDGVTPHTVVGSPCETNFVRVTAVDTGTGAPLPIGGFNGTAAINVLTTNLISVQGQTFDGAVQTPLTSNRVTYSRDAADTSQIDAFAASGSATQVTIKDLAPTTVTALPIAVALQPGSAGTFSISQGLTGARTALPAAFELVAIGTDAAGNVADPTRLLRAVTDSVTITQADYDPVAMTLLVKATSSDQTADAARKPTLTIDEFGVAAGVAVATTVPPASVTVLSSAGGIDTANVRVLVPQPLLAPTGVVASLTLPSTVVVSWTDRSDNETGFEVVRKIGTVTTVVGAPGAGNATGDVLTFADTNAPDDTFVSYSVRSVLGTQKAESDFSNQILVPITAPVLNPVSGNTSTSLVLGWTTSAKAVSYDIYRDNVLIGSVTGSTFNDTGLTPSTAYSYRVEAVGANSRSTSNSVTGNTSAAAVLAAPTNVVVVAGPTATRPRTNWSDVSQGETGYRFSRATVNVATLAAGTPTVANLPANTATYTIPIGSALTTQTLYQFTVQAVNGADVGPASSVYRYVGALPVPSTVRASVVNTGLVANRTPVGQVPVTWLVPTTAGNANILGYEVQYCVGTATNCNTSGAWTGLIPKIGRTNVNHTYTGLASGRVHTFRVRSTSAAGVASTWSNVSATPR